MTDTESEAQFAGTVVEGQAAGQQGFSREQSQHELKASREAHKQRLEHQRLANELREADRARTFGRWLLGIAFAAGLLIVVGGIAVGFAMAV